MCAVGISACNNLFIITIYTRIHLSEASNLIIQMEDFVRKNFEIWQILHVTASTLKRVIAGLTESDKVFFQMFLTKRYRTV